MNQSSSDFDAESVSSIVEHMNQDHADALQLYMKAYTRVEVTSIENLQMTDIDADGICLTYTAGDTRSECRILFKEAIGSRLKSVAGARGALVAMVKRARQ